MSSTTSPCAACKLLRRKCTQECVFAPYFPPDQPQKFENVHRVFGKSNVEKILNDLSTTQREDAVNSLAYEAEARLRDPVYGCVGLISILQHRLKHVQIDLYNAKKELSTYIGPSAMLPILQHPGLIQQHQNNSSSSSSVMPYMSPTTILGLPAGGGYNPHHHQLVIRDPQLQQPHHHHHHNHPHQQMLEAQRLAAAAGAREQQGILTTFEQQQQQQQQEFVRFNGGFEPVGPVGSNEFAAQMGGAGMSPSLALGCFDDPYQIQQQPQDHHSHSHHQLQLQLQPQLLIQQQQPQPPKQQQRSGNDDGRRVGPSC